MKRFVVCVVLLVAVLVAARVFAIDAAAAGVIHLNDDEDTGLTTSRSGFFDHGYRAGTRHAIREKSSRDNAPRRVANDIRFAYRDREYRSVDLIGSFSDWEPIEMEYDSSEERWVADVDLAGGRHEYLFVVVEDDGRKRQRTDPANPRRRHDDEWGWVSALRVDRDGEPRFDRDGDRRRDRDRDGHRRRRYDGDYSLDLVAGGGLEYQRVDGLVVFVRPRFESSEAWTPVLDSKLSYGFASSEGAARLSLLQPLTPGRELRFVVSGYDVSDYTERTGVGTDENSLTTLVFREDSRDWFRREGISLGLEAEVGRWLLARLEMRSDMHRSLEREVHAGWGGRDDFLPNPMIDDGLMRSIFARVRLGDELNHFWLEYESSDPSVLSSEFDFQQITAQYRTRLRAGRWQYLDLRLRFGSLLDGTLPAQKRYLAGGIGTVRGYTYQSLLVPIDAAQPPAYGGERLALANAEYVMGVGGDVAMAIFADTGMVWEDRDAQMDGDDWVSSVGVGILLDDDDDGGLRLDLIKPLDGDGDLMLQGRLNRPF